MEACRKAGASEVYLRYDLITKAHVEEAREAGLHAWAWCRGHLMMEKAGIKSDLTYDEVHARLIATGCHGICTNRPDLLANARAKLECPP